MGFKHKNILDGTINVLDSKGVIYTLKPGNEVIIDRDDSWPGGGIVLVNEDKQKPVKKLTDGEL